MLRLHEVEQLPRAHAQVTPSDFDVGYRSTYETKPNMS